MKHLTIVYDIPDDMDINEFFGMSANEHFEHGNVIARSWCDAIGLKNELIAALIYVQQQVESGQEIAMSRVNEAIRRATA